MARFDHLTSLLLSSRAKAQGAGALVDEDGFTVVVRSGKSGRTGGLGDGTRKGTTSIGVASRGFAKKALGQDAAKKGKGAQELPDFYKFQKMERKRQGMSGSIVSAVQQFAAVIRVKEADKK
jgi:ribosomal RNA-processing protein 7